MTAGKPIQSILIVGGGTAGWITAAILSGKLRGVSAAGESARDATHVEARTGAHNGARSAAPGGASEGGNQKAGLAASHLGNHLGNRRAPGGQDNFALPCVEICLIEAPNIPIIGVGEGTWPSMRTTLHTAGIKEADFIRECDASFKQGSKFIGWKNGADNDFYYHPYDLPEGFYEGNLAQHWVDTQPEQSFSKLACVQEHLCEKDLSPKLRTSTEYSGVANYGYHLNAGKFSEFLKRHCVEKLGVRLIVDRVTGIKTTGSAPASACDGLSPGTRGYQNDIACVHTEKSGDLGADLFVDCTGFRSLLIGQHYGVGFIDKGDEFPINRALAVQVPYVPDEPVRSATISTAQEAGWIWDIGLSTRRGVGYVFSDSHISAQQAASQLQSYLGMDEQSFEQLQPRTLSIRAGYREMFWKNNCVAVGLSAGFLEPLEASAIMLAEASANMIADQLPANRAAMEVVAARFNRRFRYRWERIIDFLKLHYALTDRSEDFWRDASAERSLSERLKEDLRLWKHQVPWKTEFDNLEEAFPIASYQYVLYGMGFATQARRRGVSSEANQFARKATESVVRNTALLGSKVESNRRILDLIRAN